MVIDTRTLPSTTTVGTDDALTDEGDLLQKSVTEHLDKLKVRLYKIYNKILFNNVPILCKSSFYTP